MVPYTCVSPAPYQLCRQVETGHGEEHLHGENGHRQPIRTTPSLKSQLLKTFTSIPRYDLCRKASCECAPGVSLK